MSRQPTPVPSPAGSPAGPPESIPAIRAPAKERANPLTRSVAGLIGLGALILLVGACLLSIPWTFGRAAPDQPPRYNDGDLAATHLPPAWVPKDAEEAARLEALGDAASLFLLGTDNLGRDLFVRCLAGGGISIGIGIAAASISVLIGTLYGALAGAIGGRVDAVMMRIVDVLYGLPYILLVVLLAVAGDHLIDVQHQRLEARAAVERTAWQLVDAAETGGAPPGSVQRVTPDRWLPERGDGADDNDAMQRVREAWRAWSDEPASRADARALARATLDATGSTAPLEPVLLALVGGDEAARVEVAARANAEPTLPTGGIDATSRKFYEVLILLAAIGGVSWLTMARVIRGQVLSLKEQPFMEAARAIGVPPHRQFVRHLLPNLLGPIIVYATLTVPQAILQESFLSFLGIGVQPPLPSWGNLAADGLVELNTVKTRWWLLLFPCMLLGITLLALNFVGEGLREAFDPKRGRT